MVDQSRVFFESRDAELTPSGEAAGTAFLLPALHDRRTLVVDTPIDPEWLHNVSFLVETVAQWWDLPMCAPKGPAGEIAVSADGVGLLFTGGVDSFFTLLEGDMSIDTLIHVQGFDIPLSDPARLASAEADARAVAENLGVRCVVVRSNLRSHPLYGSLSWERTHGGALLSIGHLLRGIVGEIVISSSAHRSATRSWGTDWRIDRYWSSSSVQVTHFGEDWWRYQKLERMAHHPLVRNHLRVCWEHRTSKSNCSHCEKCLRTMITLDDVGALDGMDVFDRGPIPERIDRLAYVSGPGSRREYGLMVEQGIDQSIDRAVRELLERSNPRDI